MAGGYYGDANGGRRKRKEVVLEVVKPMKAPVDENTYRLLNAVQK